MNKNGVIENTGNGHIVQQHGEQILLFLACVFWPIYLFPSGGFQIFVLLLLCFCAFVAIRKSSVSLILQESHLLSRVMLVFLAYSFLVNAYHAISFGSFRPIIYSLYFCFSFVVAICLSCAITDRPRILVSIYYGIAASIILQLSATLLLMDDGCVRMTLFFNNPNQLGFYALLCMTFLIFLYPSTRQNIWFFAVALLSSMWIIMVTLSIAAILCAAMLLLLMLVFSQKSVRKALGLTVLFAIPIFWISQDFVMQKFECDRFELRRIDKRQSNVFLNDSLDQSSIDNLDRSSIKDQYPGTGVWDRIKRQLYYRQYDRIWGFPEYLIFGAGEGVDRVYRGGGFKEKELHSAPGTLIFSYGIVGLGFLVYIVTILVVRRGPGVLILLIPLVLYSMFHNTLRQPFLWMLIALLVYSPENLNDLFGSRGRSGGDLKDSDDSSDADKPSD